MESNIKNISFYIFGALACIGIGAVIGWNLSKGGAKQAFFKLNFGENNLEVKLDQEQIDAPTFLGTLFSETWSRSGVVDWLKERKKIFHFEDPDVVQEFKSLPPNHSVSEALLKLSKGHIGPWETNYDTVRIGIPAKTDQPKEGYISVCSNSKYLYRQLELTKFDETSTIKLTSTGGHYNCPTGSKRPHIQLNAKDAKKLFGHTNFTGKEKALALTL